MPNMYENNDDVPVEHGTKSDDEIVMYILTMREQFGVLMSRGAVS